MEREPLRYCKGDGKVTFTRPFLMLGKVTFDHDEDVNVIERYCTGDISLFQKLKVLKGLILCSVCKLSWYTFRMEQPHMALSRAFFEALSQCKRLERLCLIAKNSVYNSQDVSRMVDQVGAGSGKGNHVYSH